MGHYVVERDGGNKSGSVKKEIKDEDHYDTRSEVSSSDEDDENHSQISNPSLSSGSFKSEGKIIL